MLKRINEWFEDTKPSSELKGTDLPSELLDQLVSAIAEYGYEDKTISHNPTPWSTQEPLRHTIHETNPELAKEVVSDVTGSDLHAPELLQTLSLISILNPVFHSEHVDRDRCDEIRVVLDAATWTQPVDRIERGFDKLHRESAPDNLSFEIRDSKTTPGIQIADLTAYSWSRNLREGDCGEAAEAINRHRFSRY